MDKRVMSFKTDDTFAEIQRIFKAALIAYGNKDFKQMKNYEVDALINRQTFASENYKKMGIKEIMSRIICLKPTTINVKVDKNDDIRVEAIVPVSLERYIIDESTGEVLDGIKECINTYSYKVVLVENKKYDKNLICENCGAEISKDTEKCPYCKTINSNKDNRLLIADIIENSEKSGLIDYYQKREKERIERVKSENRMMAEEERRKHLF